MMLMDDQHNNSNHGSHAGQPSWLERNVNLAIGLLVLACVASLIAQWVFADKMFDEHPAHFEPEKVFGFQAMFGFAAFVIVVFLGRILRIFVKRKEDYYDS